MIRKLNQKEEVPFDLLLLADETVAAIEKYIHQSEIYIYEIGNEAIGVYALYILNQKEIEIKNIAVKEHYQNKGIGKQLIQDAITRSKEREYKYIIIGTSNAAFRQLKLYQNQGFEIFDIKKDFFRLNYSKPIYENGVLLNHMIMLRQNL